MVQVKLDELAAYNRGQFIQDALKGNTPDEREVLMSGICGPCFDRVTAEDEGEDNGPDEPDPAPPHETAEDAHIDQQYEDRYSDQ